jgi:hypothetical protein
MYRITCRARVAPNCLNGQPTSRQFGADIPMSNDNTYEDHTQSIVCDPCYVMIVPMTPSGKGLLYELEPVINDLRRMEQGNFFT